MPERALSARLRAVAWLVVLSLIIGLGALKADQNRRDREQQQAYEEEIALLEKEGSEEYERLSTWGQQLMDREDARQATRDKFNGGKRWLVTRKGGNEEATWRHPRYGIELEFTFAGDDLVGFGARSGSGLLQEVNPRPPEFSRSGPAEAIRRRVPGVAGPLWLGCFAVAWFGRRYARLGAEGMLATTLALGAAHITAPHYSLTPQGLLTNDALFFSIIMLVLSVVMLAARTPRGGQRLRFGVRHLLLVTSGIAVLAALGAFGWLTLAVAIACGLLYAGVRWMRPIPPGETVLATGASD